MVKECEEWIKQKVEIKSTAEPNSELNLFISQEVKGSPPFTAILSWTIYEYIHTLQKQKITLFGLMKFGMVKIKLNLLKKSS